MTNRFYADVGERSKETAPRPKIEEAPMVSGNVSSRAALDFLTNLTENRKWDAIERREPRTRAYKLPDTEVSVEQEVSDGGDLPCS